LWQFWTKLLIFCFTFNIIVKFEHTLIRLIVNTCYVMYYFYCNMNMNNVFSPNFVMLLNWRSSVNIFSQIWQYSKYESWNLKHFFIFRQLWWFFLIKKFCQFFLNKEFMTKYSFSKIFFTKCWKFVAWWTSYFW